MSRVGKEPIPIPSGVEVTIDGGHVAVKGPEGRAGASRRRPRSRSAARATSSSCTRPDDERENRALHGLVRSLVNNMVVGVSDGFSPRPRDRRGRLPRDGAGPEPARAPGRLLPPACRVEAPDGITFEVPQPDPHHGPGLRQAAGRPGRRRHPQDPQARALQGQGHPLRRRARPAQGRQVGEVGEHRRCCRRSRAADRRHHRVRKHVRGTPRTARASRVFRSNRHVYAQVIDDVRGRTARRRVHHGGRGPRRPRPPTSTPPRAVGQRLGERAKAAGIDPVVFDRGGFRYHGRVAAVADGARERDSSSSGAHRNQTDVARR